MTFPANLTRAYILDESTAYDGRRKSEREKARFVKEQGGYTIRPNWLQGQEDDWYVQGGGELWRGHRVEDARRLLTEAGFTYNDATGDWHRGEAK